MEHEIVSASQTTGAVVAALLIFLGCYALIISEKVHRTIVALFGSALLIMVGVWIGFYDQHQAVTAIDFNTIGLLIGMMIIVEISKGSGLFQYIAIKAAKIAKGDPAKILLLFSLITALLSAFLDNVTTILLLIPITIVVCDNLRISPKPFILAEVFMSNIGGTATLIGDPPNILIGSQAGLSFMDFIKNLSPVIIIITILLLPLFYFIFKNKIVTKEEYKKTILSLNEKQSITDKKMLIKSISVIVLVILGFFFHRLMHLEAATIAIFGAAIMLFFDYKKIEDHLSHIEWVTIFFFVGLFVLVGGLVQVGVLSWAAEKIISLTAGNLATTSAFILWGSAILSAFVDNIPFVATMIPLIKAMQPVFTDLNPLWWSLALGACLGGNGTIIGASANLVATGIAEKSNNKITFKEFFKYGFGIMILTIIISNIYLWLRYW